MFLYFPFSLSVYMSWCSDEADTVKLEKERTVKSKFGDIFIRIMSKIFSL